MGDKTHLLSVEFPERRVRLDGEILPLGRRFVDLYCYLAAVRVNDPSRNGGFVDCDQIQNLASWSRNQTLSVGKQISRHAAQMREKGIDLVEAQQKVTGPFRLAVCPESIRLDTTPEAVIAALTISASTRTPGFQHVEAAFKFSEQYWRGIHDFHLGKLSESLTAFREAASIASTPHRRLAASFYVERILERQGEMEAAEHVRRNTRPDLEAAGRYQLWAESRDLVLAAWREYRHERIDSAEALYRKALEPARRQGLFEVLGEIHNGLGEIAKRRGQYQEALRHYLEALDLWLVADYFYGFQAVYFNIGVLYRLWGDELRRGGRPYAARPKYESAAQWTERCIQLCNGMELGFDTSEAEAQLASLYLKLGRFGKALTTALSAQQIAFRARNPRSILASMRVLAAAYLVRNEPEKAIAEVRKSSESLTERFRNVLADQIGKFLR